MSDYVKAKVIRLPFPQNLIKKLGVDDCWDCEDYLREVFGEQWDNHRSKTWLEIECTERNYYLDYVIEYQYGCCEGEYGYVFLLDDADKQKYCPLFDRVGIEYNPDDLRKVVYCYYNGCECPDYYDPNDITFENL